MDKTESSLTNPTPELAYVGIDVSKDSFEAAWHTTTWQGISYANEPSGFKGLLNQLPKHALCVVEASGPYYLRLAYFLHQHGRPVAVVNPLSVRRFAQMQLRRAKTDRLDARLIASYAVMVRPEAWQVPPLFISQMRQIEAALESLTKQQTMLRNQLEALRQVPFQEKVVRRTYERLLKNLGQEIEKLEQRMEDLGREHCAGRLEALESIPGIGRKTALMLIALTHDFERFQTSKQLIAYVGFSPRVWESGTSIRGRGHITKMGLGRIRRMLYMCTWSAKRYNQGCQDLYERLKARGKPERVIKVALANKLLKQAFAIGTNMSTYDPHYQPQSCF